MDWSFVLISVWREQFECLTELICVFSLTHPCAKKRVAGAPQHARYGQSSVPRAAPLPRRAYFFSSRAVSKLRSAAQAQCFALRASCFVLRISFLIPLSRKQSGCLNGLVFCFDFSLEGAVRVLDRIDMCFFFDASLCKKKGSGSTAACSLRSKFSSASRASSSPRLLFLLARSK